MPPPTAPERLTVVVLCRNEADHIEACLQSLVDSDFDFADRGEIVVVDGRSEDGTRAKVAAFANRFPYVRLVDNPAKVTPAAFNLGIQHSRSDAILFVGAHATYASDYVRRCFEGLQANPEADVMGGLLGVKTDGTAWSEAISVATTHRVVTGNASHRTSVADSKIRRVDAVFGGCFRIRVFEKHGMFHPRLTRAQDREYFRRLKRADATVLLDPTIRCNYKPRGTFASYVQWSFRGAYWLEIAHRFVDTPLRSLRNFLPAGLLANVVLLLLVSAASGLGSATAVLTMPLLLYALLICGFAVQQAWRTGNPNVGLILAALVPAIHLSYGGGTIVGFCHRLIRGDDVSAPPALVRANASTEPSSIHSAPQRVA
ncbi:glycosyltransferase [Roseimaritima sediminicola]|uniref:glycosyltransferase n=1 Tax=Roseimaritima sediminicola TaxID=2662066 RepID=UPI001386743C|nr:glycosyltransferase [Roseimaritima sediminicola]